MNGSGKEVLLKILSELSTISILERDLNDATKKVRAGLLLRGSTSDENFELVEQIIWGSEKENGSITRQGVALKRGNIFIADIFEDLWCSEVVENELKKIYPNLTSQEYEAVMMAIWLIISSCQMYENLLSVERKGEIDVESWVKVINRKVEHHKNERR